MIEIFKEGSLTETFLGGFFVIHSELGLIIDSGVHMWAIIIIRKSRIFFSPADLFFLKKNPSNGREMSFEEHSQCNSSWAQIFSECAFQNLFSFESKFPLHNKNHFRILL